MTLETRIKTKLGRDVFKTDAGAHIVVNQKVCEESCQKKPCLHVCPARLFSLREGKIHLESEGCLECGTCKIACPQGALDWGYPRGGFGVQYRFG